MKPTFEETTRLLNQKLETLAKNQISDLQTACVVPGGESVVHAAIFPCLATILQSLCLDTTPQEEKCELEQMGIRRIYLVMLTFSNEQNKRYQAINPRPKITKQKANTVK